MDENSISLLPAFTTGLPSAAPIHLIPAVPSIQLMVADIVRSTAHLCLVLWKFGVNNAREWQLAWIAFMDSMSLYPSCTLNGRFLFEFYICHPADWHYNTIYQQYWLQLHSISNMVFPRLITKTQLVWPTDTSDSYAAHHNLIPFRKWLNICHMDTHIHGPFDFASVCGRKTRDRVAQIDWDVLHCHWLMFHNPVTSFYIPTYLINFDLSTHMAFHNEAACKLLLIKQSQTSDTEEIYSSPWQKALGLVGCPTPVFLLFPPFLGPACLLWNQCGIFLHSFCGGYCDFCKYILPFQPCWCIDQSAVVLWACHLFLGHLRDWVLISLLTWKFFWCQDEQLLARDCLDY
jgi:hypothetical protein